MNRLDMSLTEQQALYMRLKKLVVKHGVTGLAASLGVTLHTVANAWRRKGKCGTLRANIDKWEEKMNGAAT